MKSHYLPIRFVEGFEPLNFVVGGRITDPKVLESTRQEDDQNEHRRVSEHQWVTDPDLSTSEPRIPPLRPPERE